MVAAQNSAAKARHACVRRSAHQVPLCLDVYAEVPTEPQQSRRRCGGVSPIPGQSGKYRSLMPDCTDPETGTAVLCEQTVERRPTWSMGGDSGK